jgi:hypothetical protein
MEPTLKAEQGNFKVVAEKSLQEYASIKAALMVLTPMFPG